MARLVVASLGSAVLAAASRDALVASLGLGTRGPRVGPASVAPGIIVNDVDGTVTNSTLAWSWYSQASEPWTGEKNLSFALWGAGTYAAYQWGSAPTYIADYACQGAYILEKSLSHGDALDADVAAWFLATLPIAADGRPWEAQNAEWHVAHQGHWEVGAEVLIQSRVYAAHTGDASLFTTAPERLVCASPDGGATWTLAGVPQPGLTDAVCAAAPTSLPQMPGQPRASQARVFYDTPSAPYDEGAPSAGSPAVHNSGRLLAETLTTGAAMTHFALPLARRARTGDAVWWAHASVIDTASGAVVGGVDVQPVAGDGFGGAWTAIPASGGGSFPPGTYTIVLQAAASPPPGSTLKQSDSWFVGPAWASNMRPGAPGGGSHGTYGAAPLWVRNTSAPATRPALAEVTVPDAAAAVALELTRARAAGGRGRALGDYLAMSLAHVLALSSQVPVTGVPGGYDVFVIPDRMYRGDGAPEVNTGCSYYDIIRMGGAPSYHNVRALEGLQAYAEMQAAGLLPSACPAGSSLGVDNAAALATGATPCYTAAEVAAVAQAMSLAIGNRFADSASGEFVTWFGCSCLGAPGAAVADCGLQFVVNGTLPANNTCLNAVALDFLPTAALAAKLGVPAGGVSTAATLAHFEVVRDTGADAGNSSLGPGYWHTAMRGLETGGPGTWVANIGWDLVDADGWALRSVNQTGDWQFFSPDSIAAGGSTGYGNFPTNAENGGRFFTTSAMIWEAHSAPGSASAPPGPYAAMYRDWRRMVNGLEGVGVQLAAMNASVPLLPGDRSFLSTPVADPLVTYLCAKVRAQFNYPNVTDLWGQRLCDYYSDNGWGTPENGVALYSFAKGMLGLRPRADGVLALLGSLSPSPVAPGMAPWKVAVPTPPGWPAEVASLTVNALSVAGVSLVVACTAGGGQVACTTSTA